MGARVFPIFIFKKDEGSMGSNGLPPKEKKPVASSVPPPKRTDTPPASTIDIDMSDDAFIYGVVVPQVLFDSGSSDSGTCDSAGCDCSGE